MPHLLKQPAYRFHKARNSAVVTLNGKNHYLGPWQSPESHEKYARLIAEWRRNNGVLPDPVDSASGVVTINELILAYFRYAQGRYVKHGEPTSEVGCIRQALRPLRKLYGTTPAIDFGPKALKDVRQAMIDAGRARKSINRDVDRIKRIFRWAVEEELLVAAVYDRLRCVRGLGKGQTAARETQNMAPVPSEHVDAILPYLPPPVAAMVRLQLLTGVRPQEVMSMKPSEVRDRGDGVWLYTPAAHKGDPRAVLVQRRLLGLPAPVLPLGVRSTRLRDHLRSRGDRFGELFAVDEPHGKSSSSASRDIGSVARRQMSCRACGRSHFFTFFNSRPK